MHQARAELQPITGHHSSAVSTDGNGSLCGRRTFHPAHQSISPSPDLAGVQSISLCCPLPTGSTLVMLAVGTEVQLACDTVPASWNGFS